MAISFLVQLFFIILLSPTITKTNVTLAETLCLENEKNLLLELKNELVFNSSDSRKLVQWNQTDDCCSWNGVECDDGGHVVSLKLAGEGISGGLNDSSSLFSLNYLEELYLANNFFSGSIPFTFSNLTQLIYLYLSHNLFSGSIPISIFTLPSLQVLDLQQNQFSGRVTEFSIVNVSNLYYLYLSGNRLESPIPDSFFKIQSLSYLYLSNNLFNNTFQLENILSLPNLIDLDLSRNNLSLDPTSIHSSSYNSPVKESFLEILDLSNNKISGEIPSWIWEIGNGSLTYLNLSCNMLVGLQKPYNIPASLSLSFLDLHSNQLQGELPSFSLLQRADEVDLSNNYFDKSNNLDIGNFSAPYLSSFSLKNNSLSGSFPTFIYNFRNLEVLDLSVNNLCGSMPPRLFENFKYLQVLNLGRNNFSGHIPHTFCPNCRLMRTLDLSHNHLVGNVPLPLANWSLLTVLNLSYNKLSGKVPTFLCKATKLQILDLSANNLNGNIPLCLLEHLPMLNLGTNNITGRIPKITADCRLQYLDLGNNNLIGEVPVSLKNCKLLEVINVGGNKIDGSFPCMLPLSLRVLVLRANRFHGEVRCNKSWPNLQIIDIAHNNFSGYPDPLNFTGWRQMMRDTGTKLSYKNLGFTVISRYSWQYYREEEVTLTIKGDERKLVKIWPDFTSIDLSSNNFQGDIPDSIGELNALYLLNLSHNSLTGTIPKSFSNLTWLGALDLSVNLLSGKIPKEIAGLTFLQLMNVSRNKLVGEIPVGSQIQTFSDDCFEGNIGLCGPPLNIRCTNTSPAPKHGNVEYSDREIDWDYVFAAAGYAVGLGSFSWVLLFCRNFREKYFEKIEDVCEKIFDCGQKRKRRDRRRRAVRNQVRR